MFLFIIVVIPFVVQIIPFFMDTVNPLKKEDKLLGVEV